ncbi:MAG TPA: IS200/IS605 family transposase [Anaerolineales bacterium]|jgi:REP element-mobilizing transposase RayT/CheY-like chemotaxis protein|nr:IS200/IS605 family transposase [Anaerolineales bacterium]
MTNSLLIVSADTSFAKVLLYGLEQEGYRVQIVKGKGEAVVRADEANCSLAFLDMDLGDRAVLDIGKALRMLNPGIKLIIFSREDTPPILDEIRPWVLSPKPYFLPDVLNMLNNKSTPISQPIRQPQASAPAPSNQVQMSNPVLPWLQDVTKAAQHLTRLTLESSAQAALITRGDNLWAYAGQLSQGAAKELAVTVTRHWDGQKGSDLLRFVRLEATKAEHMLYATRIAEDVVLALVFDAETPFSTIRTQAGQLAQSLSIPGAEGLETSVEQKQMKASYDAPTEYLDDEGSEDFEFPNISDILADVPPPIPDGSMSQMEDEEQWGTRPSPSRSSQYSRESSPAIRVNDLLVSNQNNEQTVEHVVQDFDATMPSKSRPRPETPIRRPMPGELDETRPHSITEVAGRVMLEPISPGLYNLTYACLLVPRFSSHYLTGDMSDRISEWLPQICIAFGWRLEYLAVRPEYVQWVLNVPPATSPGYLMRIMRQQTSEKIFIEFPRMKKENPSGDFWAPGYLIMGGTQPHPPQLVKDYIKQTRTRQGYSEPRR